MDHSAHASTVNTLESTTSLGSTISASNNSNTQREIIPDKESAATFSEYF